MKRRLAALSISILCLGILSRQSHAQTEDGQAIIKQASAIYACETRGIVGYRTITNTRIKSPVFNQESQSESLVASKDGILVRASLNRLLINGKEATKQQLQEQQAKTNEAIQKGQNFIKMPFDPRFVDEYSFNVSKNSPAGIKVVSFSSSRKDEQHGNGELTLDKKLHVVEMHFTPNKMPPHVSSCVLHFECGEVAPGIFGIRTLNGDYRGSYGPISGSFTLKQCYDRYQRFNSVGDAISR